MTDREWDRRLHIRTTGREDESDANYSPYEPTPYSVLERLVQSGTIRRKDHLLDYGCGKGRVVCFMASQIGCHVTGLDHSGKLIDIARENRSQSRTGDRTVLKCCRAEQYPVTDENVFFFFNPFSEKIFEIVLRQLVRSWYERPRRMTVICYYPSEAYIACLEAIQEATLAANIECSDLFNGQNTRERIVVYEFVN